MNRRKPLDTIVGLAPDINFFDILSQALRREINLNEHSTKISANSATVYFH